MAKEEHSAIPSWSGYVYQGKVAVYHVLRTIEERFRVDSSTEFDNCELEIEWQEDFAIKIDGTYDSLHQVKAYEASASPTVYNKALKDLYDKLSRGIGNTGWLNIWNPINFTVRTKSNNFKELKSSNQTIVEKSYLQSVLDQVEIYTYCNGNQYCDLDEIDKLIAKKIEEIYNHNNYNISSLTDKQYEFVRFKLYQIIDDHIVEVHKDPTKKKKTIPFTTLLAKFSVNYEEYSKEYEYIKVKNNFFEKIYEYCNNSKNCSCSIDQCDISCDLYKIEKKLESKTAEEVYKIILQSTPHYKSISDLLDRTGLTFGLSKIFHTLNKNYQTNQYLYKKDATYLPTTIHTLENIPVIAKNILENKELDSIVPQYEIDIFISKDVSSNDMLKDARDCKDVKDKDIDELFGEQREAAVNRINQIQIKPLDDVKGELA